MNSVKKAVESIQKRGSIGLMGHIIAGYPDYSVSREAAMGIAEGGADLIEIQFPFSDPTADGPTIESACYQSLTGGFSVEKGFELVRDIASSSNAAILIMSYGNIPYRFGLEDFIIRAGECGAAGLIIPDLTVENDEGYSELCRKHDMCNINVIAPGADTERIKLLSQNGSGFLYTVTRRGITGKKTEMDPSTIEWIETVKASSSLPVAVGFGIQSANQIEALENHCEIAIVGSHFVRTINSAIENKKDIKSTLANETRSLLS
jgi:tryptophan synthase alpha chain